MQIPLFKAAALAGVIPLLCACASGGGYTSTLFLEPWSPPPDQHCSFGNDTLPAFDAVFDSVAVIEAVAGLPDSGATVMSVSIREPPPDNPPAELPVWKHLWPPRVDSVAVVASTLSDASTQQLTNVLLRSARQDRKDSFILRVDTEPTPRIRLGPNVNCRPVVKNRSEIQGLLSAAAQTGLQGTAVVQILVTKNGHIGAVSIRTSSGNFQVDQAIAEVAHRLSFHPGLINRIPITLAIEIPLTMEL